MSKELYNETDRENDNIDFAAIRKKYGHLTVEEKRKILEEFKQNLLKRWAEEDSQK